MGRLVEAAFPERFRRRRRRHQKKHNMKLLIALALAAAPSALAMAPYVPPMPGRCVTAGQDCSQKAADDARCVSDCDNPLNCAPPRVVIFTNFGDLSSVGNATLSELGGSDTGCMALGLCCDTCCPLDARGLGSECDGTPPLDGGDPSDPDTLPPFSESGGQPCSSDADCPSDLTCFVPDTFSGASASFITLSSSKDVLTKKLFGIAANGEYKP